MLRFIHAVGLLKLAVLVPVHACTQQIILVFVRMWYVCTHSSIFVVPSNRNSPVKNGILRTSPGYLNYFAISWVRVSPSEMQLGPL
jgi:hypothetical protein